MFTSSVIDALKSSNKILLVEFASFSVSKGVARIGHNRACGEALQIKVYNQPKFKTGQILKNSCNNR